MKIIKFSLLLSLALSCLIACSNNFQAPVEEVGVRHESTNRNTQSISKVNSSPLVVKGSHEVSKGETLIAIAFAYNLEYTALARVNSIVSPYVIYPGQILELDVTRAPSRKSSNKSLQKNVQNSNVIKSRSAPESTSIEPAKVALRWAWPSRGKVIGNYSIEGIENKGIDIAGVKGDAVLAAEAGEVVYAGSGLLRYGDLLIIRHNAKFLSAYAHNSKLLVKDGDQVSRGQTIAELGSTGIDREMLHFEIRENGEPVDPLMLLPAR